MLQHKPGFSQIGHKYEGEKDETIYVFRECILGITPPNDSSCHKSLKMHKNIPKINRNSLDKNCFFCVRPKTKLCTWILGYVLEGFRITDFVIGRAAQLDVHGDRRLDRSIMIRRRPKHNRKLRHQSTPTN